MIGIMVEVFNLPLYRYVSEVSCEVHQVCMYV